MGSAVTRVGIIGVGGMGGRHAANLTKRISGAEVVALMDIDESRLETVSARCGGCRTFADPHALIADPEVDAVVIASPDVTHAELSLACLDAAKPVLCEKPLACNATDAEKVCRAEAALGHRLIQVGFMREYDPAHLELKTAIDAGEIGLPLLYRGYHYNPAIGRPRSVEDVATNSAVHDIHSARWLTGQEISKVYVQSIPSSPAEPASCRILVAQMEFRNGNLGIVQVSTESGYGYEVVVEMTGETGLLTTAPLSGPVARRAEGCGQRVAADWLDRFDTAYINEAQAWIDACAAGECSGPTAWDGYTSLAVAEAWVESVVSGMPELVGLVDSPELYQEQKP